MKSVLLIYASTSGNTEMVVSQVAAILAKEQYRVTVQRAECSQPDDLKGYDVCVLGCGTYGHGLLEYQMEKFTRTLKATTPSPIKGRRFAVIGLGDDKYDSYYNMESAKILETLIEEQGGTLIMESLRINKSPIPHLKGKVTEWTEQLSKILKTPPSRGVRPTSP